MAGRERTQGVDGSGTIVALNNLAVLYRKQDRFADAEPIHREAVTRAKRGMPEGHWYISVFQLNHAKCLIKLDRLEEAESMLVEAYEAMTTSLGSEHDRTKAAAAALVEIFESRIDSQGVALWKKRADQDPN